ncbi:uncharacterized protein LOC110679428 [Aedes aegypti]|uniref:Uncharacterized protein n=1 Tax=Aedes aegypti TaxID=7159 RepID=A0A6I8U8Y0_AEDAE|nr:uncharacterized protein LOC110679428 [Aedes aegypti]
MAAKEEYFNPKTGENHGIFGYKYLKFHRMRDPKWTAGDKMIQYVGITKIYDRDRKLQALKTIMARKNKQQYTRRVNKMLKDDTGYLNVANVGDAQRIKNIFQGHFEMQRAYHPLMIENIVEKIDQRTFAKRKALDALVHRFKTLSAAYEKELIKVSELQDRTKFMDPQELYEEIEAKSYELELRHCGTRIRTADAINRAYNEIIRTMLKDSIYYDPVLNALQEDLTEQHRFINKIRNTGIPTMKNVQSLQQEFEDIDRKTSKELTDRFNALMEHREVLNANNRRVKTLVRRDSDFDVNPSRYDRDTRSMADLKIQMEEIEKILKQLKNATSCGKPKEIYPRVKQQIRDSEKMKKNLEKREHQRSITQIEADIAEMCHDELANDFTPDEIRRIENYRLVEKKINAEKIKQKELLENKSDLKDARNMLKSAFQHILDVLRNVDNGVVNSFKSESANPDSLLDLPYFDFNQVMKNPPPKLLEGDLLVFISKAKTKISNLMNIYRDVELTSKQDILNLKYQSNILEEYNKQNMKSMKDIGKSIMEDIVIDDPNVYSRKQIKAISANIVENNMKRED